MQKLHPIVLLGGHSGRRIVAALSALCIVRKPKCNTTRVPAESREGTRTLRGTPCLPTRTRFLSPRPRHFAGPAQDARFLRSERFRSPSRRCRGTRSAWRIGRHHGRRLRVCVSGDTIRPPYHRRNDLCGRRSECSGVIRIFEDIHRVDTRCQNRYKVGIKSACSKIEYPISNRREISYSHDG